MNRLQFAILSILSGAGCADSDVKSADVVQLTLCPEPDEGVVPTPCSISPAADAHSSVLVKVCAESSSVPDSERRTDLTATLRATRGEWVGHEANDPSTFSVSFGSSRCHFATLTVDQTPGANQIEATLLGYTVSKTLLQVPAKVEHVDFTAANVPPLQGTAPSTVQLVVAAHTATGGLPSTGTRVTFSAMNQQPAGNVTMSPLATELDSDGRASVNVFVPAGVQKFTVVGTVIAPAPEDQPNQGLLDIERQ